MILIYTHRLDVGGAEFALVGIANAINKAGHRVVFVVGSHGGAVESMLAPEVTLISFGTKNTRSDIRPLSRFLEHHRPEVVFTSLFRCNVVLSLAVVLSKFSGEVVLRESTQFYERYARNWGARIAFSGVYCAMSLAATKVIVPNAAILPGLAKLSKRYAAKAQVVPNPVRAGYRPPKKRAIDSPLSVIGVGRLEPIKGFDLLVAACAELNNLDFRLSIFGNGSLRDELDALCRTAGRNGVLRPGTIDAEQIYPGHHLFVCTSYHEGFPNAVVEAIVSGLGVIIVGSPNDYSTLIDELGLPEVCFVPQRSASDLAARIRAAAGDLSRFQADGDLVQRYLSRVEERVVGAVTSHSM